MKRVVFIVLASCLCLAWGVSRTDYENLLQRNQQKTSTPVTQNKIIDYEILRSWIPGRSGTGMEILVSPNSTKEEVLVLARSLVDKYRSKGLFIAMIFDSKEAWVNRNNDNYPEEKFFKHKLVSIMVPLDLSFQSQEIVWTAEKRDDPKR